MEIPDTSELYKVTKKDIAACAMSMAESFSEDMEMCSFFGIRKDPVRRLYEMFRFILRASLKHGHVYASGPGFEGVVVWLPENKTALTTKDFFLNGGIRMILRNGIRMAVIMGRYEDFAHGIHRKHIREPHWYLLSLSVRKEHRKKGFSSMLMRPFLQYFDDNGVPCYLETGGGNNLEMYKHYGFEIVESIKNLGSGGEFNAMLRQPKSHDKKIKEA